ncbi:hypothetical protein PPTG_17373 [Phytophthora nicotianae INRA-310]|uniref:Uncharacterized protein n=1 Tax=Phytophthora nicotianae (strain INRA-310) TaxID=761204 RepID=W2PKT9_PHYN3|nr:hypothetical protein PPTG_17373 [Phytophthora nicotianae INRA-310]ETN01472.1 hypothetical protein PPTG_17373 [Phytophthora nicotianae INRA-310]
MQQTLHKSVSMHEATSSCNCTANGTNDTGVDTSCVREPSREDVIAESHSLGECWYNWYTQELWNTATEKKQQFVRVDLKARVNVMMIGAGRDINVSSPLLDRDGVSYRMWEQALRTLAEDMNRKTNRALGNIDRDGNSKTARSLRKRWRNWRLKHRQEYDAFCSDFITLKACNSIVDCFTPDTHLWRQKDLE